MNRSKKFLEYGKEGSRVTHEVVATFTHNGMEMFVVYSGSGLYRVVSSPGSIRSY